MMKKVLSALITIDNYNKLKELSEKKGISMASMLNIIISEYEK